jgi:hypothetical protein
MKRLPTGVIVLAVLATFVGIMDLLWGLRMMGVVTFGPVESGNGVFLSGLLTFVVGLIWLGVAGALTSLKPWGLMFVQIMAIFGLINAVFAMFGTGSIATGIGLMILPGFVFWYANRADIVERFVNSGNR